MKQRGPRQGQGTGPRGPPALGGWLMVQFVRFGGVLKQYAVDILNMLRDPSKSWLGCWEICGGEAGLSTFIAPLISIIVEKTGKIH